MSLIISILHFGRVIYAKPNNLAKPMTMDNGKYIVLPEIQLKSIELYNPINDEERVSSIECVEIDGDQKTERNLYDSTERMKTHYQVMLMAVTPPDSLLLLSRVTLFLICDNLAEIEYSKAMKELNDASMKKKFMAKGPSCVYDALKQTVEFIGTKRIRMELKKRAYVTQQHIAECPIFLEADKLYLDVGRPRKGQFFFRVTIGGKVIDGPKVEFRVGNDNKVRIVGLKEYVHKAPKRIKTNKTNVKTKTVTKAKTVIKPSKKEVKTQRKLWVWLLAGGIVLLILLIAGMSFMRRLKLSKANEGAI
ncbi:hypothetical protein ECANGB1_1135 [Enterospora canceri]|uniref:Uncharacterized protein n=1 Tax=Enterospora canceri TaxID=1081671 RepID=A0A1Y1S6R6_9MICR|nr:hypothetical protein ECANGB1_1135 [Enterospora canceri]